MKRSKQIRIIIGILLIAFVVGLLALDYWLDMHSAVASVVVLMGLAGFWEFSQITGMRAGAERRLDLALWGLLGTGYFLGLAWWQGVNGPLPAEFVVGGIAATALGAFVSIVARDRFVEAFPHLLSCLLGVLLFGLLFSYIIRIYHLGQRDEGLIRGVVFFLGVKGTDIVAYLVGSAIGRRQFLKVSPKKTLEGSGAALLFGGAWFAGAGALWPDVFFLWSAGIGFGIILAVSSALGDLSESLIKRYYQVKDSGSLLPEYGGVLDMIDSFLFSAFLFWCLL